MQGEKNARHKKKKGAVRSEGGLWRSHWDFILVSLVHMTYCVFGDGMDMPYEKSVVRLTTRVGFYFSERLHVSHFSVRRRARMVELR